MEDQFKEKLLDFISRLESEEKLLLTKLMLSNEDEGATNLVELVDVRMVNLDAISDHTTCW